FLEVPYTTIVIAAIFPAMMHYAGVFTVVHLMARRLGLKGLTKEQLPILKAVWADGWANLVPLIGLLVVLFSGYTPYMSAFCGISLAIITGMSRVRAPITLIYAGLFISFVVWKFSGGAFSLSMSGILIALSVLGCFNPQTRTTLEEMSDTFVTGVKYALAVGAASAAVGIVIGVINTTGIGFRIGFMVTQAASNLGTDLSALLTFGDLALVSTEQLTLFFSLVFVAMACILMGAGVPTTALYIMLVSVAQPALSQLGVPPIASHMFVLYYGVVAEITPPVCTSAYAAAAIANSNPFRTGISAFTLGLGKVVAPMAFVYAPVLLIVSSTGFDLWEFTYTALSCIAGVVSLSASVVGYWYAPMHWTERVLAALAGIIFIAPTLSADLVAIGVLLPVIVAQYAKHKRHVAEA
ncbi:MAG: TRAP transporter large permease subunit, partial [Pseudomonadota bacterium]